MSGGLTNQGYIASTVQEEVDDLNTSVLANVSNTLDLSPDQPLGQLIGIFAEKFTEITEALATVYNAINPEAAEGQLLTNVCAITGTYPQVATYSTVVCNLTLNANTTVSAGATAIVSGSPNDVWVLEANAVNSTGSQQVVSATFRSQTPGPQTGNAGTITVIGTPTVGWVSVTNPADAIQGLAGDTDTTLRQKRAIELLGQGSGDLDAIRSAVLKVTGVQACFVIENTSMQDYVQNGFFTYTIPAKSFEVIIWDGAGMLASNNAVAQAIWDNKPSGILPYGLTSGNAVDATNQTRTMSFSRCSQVPVYISVNTVQALTASQTAGVKAALTTFALSNWQLGVNVFWNSLFGLVYGVIGYSNEVSSLYIGTTPSPTGTTDIACSLMQIATLSSANILVNGV